MVNGFAGGLLGGATVAITIRAIDKFSRQFSSASRGMRALATAGKVAAVGVAGVGAALVGLGISAGKAAINFAEVESKFNTVFSGLQAEADATAQNLVNNFGLSTRASKELLSGTGDLLTGFGFAQDEALDMSNQVQKLAVDLASFTNIEGGAERASRALTKALLGERESVKELGIAILESDVQARLAEKGLENLTGEALRQAKAQATLEIAMEQSKNAIGDYSRTLDSPANQIRLFQARSEDLKLALGQALLPVFSDIIKVLNEELLPALKPLIPIVGEALVTVFRAFIPILRSLIPAISELVPLIADLFAQALNDIFKELQPLIPDMVELTKALLELAVAVLPLLISALKALVPIMKIVANVATLVLNIFTKILEILGPIIDKVADFLSKAGDFAGGIIEKVIPEFQQGGIVQDTGLALVHKGERIIPRVRANSGGGISINFFGDVVGLNEEEISRRLKEELFNKVSL